jgi:hypothetical protein
VGGRALVSERASDGHGALGLQCARVLHLLSLGIWLSVSKMRFKSVSNLKIMDLVEIIKLGSDCLPV